MKDYKVNIISHTHWDREWYLNSPYTNEWLIPFFRGLFRMLEKEPDYKFVLDGQLSMIDDYFEELDKNGFSVTEAKRKIKGYVERKSLYIGPYYLQPDWQIVSEESLVRNILIGKNMAKELGGSMNSGWMLDNFGQISQTAQIHAQSELNGLFVWRGVEMDPSRVESEFLWESPDGTRLLSIYLLNSYRNIMRLAEYKEIMQERMSTEVAKLKPFATTSNLLMMNGYDQEIVPDDIQPYILNGDLNGKGFRTVQTDPDSYIESIQKESPKLQLLSGPLYSGRFIAVFPGVLSSRMYQKIENHRMQNLLEKQVEPISAFCWLNGLQYDETQILLAWKTLLKNHPHDSICGVSIDDVHKDMDARFRLVHQLGSSVLEKRFAELAGLIDSSSAVGDEAVIIFNTLPYARPGIVHVNGREIYTAEVPSMGYRVVTADESPYIPVTVEDQRISNGSITLTVERDGTYSVKNEKTGTEFKGLGIIEDMGDSGDEYNYSYPDTDKRFLSTDYSVDIRVIRASAVQAVIRIAYVMELPISDCDNHTRRTDDTLSLPVVTYLTVTADTPYVSCKTVLRNTVKDHRMRVLFPTGIPAESSFASSPFDITERPVCIKDYDESEIPEYVSSVIVGAREAKPSTYFHTSGLIDLSNDREGLAVLSKGLAEYQIIEDDTIALTLFRSVGWIAKDINTRIGDAGPEIFTPDAQCLREMVFEYAVCPHEGDVHSGVVQCQENYCNDLMTVTTPKGQGILPSENSWFSLTDTQRGVKITAVKKSEKNGNLIIRGVNTSPVPADAILKVNFNVLEAAQVNLMESHQDPIRIQDNQLTLHIPGKRIFTLMIKPEEIRIDELSPSPVLIEKESVVEDFSKYPYADYVTDEDISEEKRRAETLKENIDHPMYRRTALEAQLSAILTQQRKDETVIRELGYQLNEARVQRRIHDYITKN